MSQPILSFPFRLAADRSVQCVAQETPQADSEQLAVLCLTRKTERTLAPGFGVTDPTFTLAGLEAPEIRAGLEQFGPPVTLTTIDPVWDGHTQRLRITHDRNRGRQ